MCSLAQIRAFQICLSQVIAYKNLISCKNLHTSESAVRDKIEKEKFNENIVLIFTSVLNSKENLLSAICLLVPRLQP